MGTPIEATRTHESGKELDRAGEARRRRADGLRTDRGAATAAIFRRKTTRAGAWPARAAAGSSNSGPT